MVLPAAFHLPAPGKGVGNAERVPLASVCQQQKEVTGEALTVLHHGAQNRPFAALGLAFHWQVHDTGCCVDTLATSACLSRPGRRLSVTHPGQCLLALIIYPKVID